MRYLLTFFTFISIATLIGCAAMQENYRTYYCNYDGAYKKGMNDAKAGEPMMQNMSELCSVEQKANAEKGYREGYTSFLRTAPQKIEINVNHSTDQVTSNCKSNIDCNSYGKWCRDRGDGIHLCLGNEPQGGYCEGSGDCGTGLFCKEVEYKIKKCM